MNENGQTKRKEKKERQNRLKKGRQENGLKEGKQYNIIINTQIMCQNRLTTEETNNE